MNCVFGIGVASIEHLPARREFFAAASMLAHQGGWDEALLVGLPLALIGLLLWVANRRVSAQLVAAEAERPELDESAATRVNPSHDTPDAP